MSTDDENIARWLEQEVSDEEEILNEDCSDVELDDTEDNVLQEDCESDSEDSKSGSSSEGEQVPLGNEDNVPSLRTYARGRSPVTRDSFSSEDEVPLVQHQTTSRNYFGKNRFRWSSAPCTSRSRILRHNIVSQAPGVKPAYRDILTNDTTPLDIWKLYFTDEMLEKIVQHTNEKIRKMRPQYKKTTNVQDLDLMELKAFIGLLFYSAIFKENHEHYTAWYNTDGSGREIYRCVMSRSRLEVLLSAIRFDDAETRQQRQVTDLSAPVSELFALFIQQCREVYNIDTCACVDEMLVAFRGRCKFKMYMPKKPAKYGLKIMCLTDARNGYLLNAYIYLGKGSDGLTLTGEQQRLSKPTQAVLRLISVIERTNRNITADNWFCSIELVNILKDKQLTLVGTLKKNKREIPPEFKASKKRTVESSVFGFTKDMTLVSYVPKKNKAVVMISSMHHTVSVDENTKKPEVIMYYNKTKIGVDLLDQRCSNYSTARRTRRWPLVIFYRLLDISLSNAYIFSLCNQAQRTGSRFKFIKQLAEQLTRPHMKRRRSNEHIPRDLRSSIDRILQVEEEIPSSSGADKLETRKTCSTCEPKKKRKTFHLCFVCKKPICVECSQKMCRNCRGKN